MREDDKSTIFVSTGNGTRNSWISAPVFINSNSELATFCTGNGTGTEGDPYVIKDLQINSVGATGACLYINNTNTYVKIKNCTFQGAIGVNQVGICVNHSSYVTVTNCTVQNNNMGIVIAWSNNILVNASNASFNIYAGIGVTNTTACNVTSNIVRNNSVYAIGVASSSTVLISANDATDVGIAGIIFSEVSGSTITGNTAISSNASYGISLIFSNNNEVDGNAVSDSRQAGIMLNDADDNNITANIISHCNIGIYLSASAGRNSSGNEIAENNVSRSVNFGILLDRARFNVVYLNNFLSNYIQAGLGVGMSLNNDWNKTSHGNYWSDYSVKYPGATNDGIVWSDPYQLFYVGVPQPGLYDMFPLVTPVLPNRNAPSLTPAGVSPLSGTQVTQFNFQLTYTDLDNNYPVTMVLMLNSSSYPMHKQTPSDTNYADGCVFVLSLYIQPGIWNYGFNCSDTRYSVGTATSILTVGLTNLNAPSLNNGAVSPAHGFARITYFEFTVRYSDPDNNAPASITVNVTSSNSTATYSMSKQDSLDTNYVDGCVYVCQTTLASINNYTYHFNASDGVQLAGSIVYSYLEVDAEYSISPTGGMLYSWTGWYENANNPHTTIFGTETFSGTGIITVASSLSNRQINGTSRVIVNDYGSQQLRVGSHEPTRVFTDLAIGRKVLISVVYWITGDQEFTVIGETERVFINKMFKCWVLQSPEGSLAYYDQYSGFLLNGTFYSKWLTSNYTYCLQMAGTTVSLSPNTHVPTLGLSTVLPSSGYQNTLFTFRVTFTDADDYAPVSINVTINGTSYVMAKQNPTETTYADGCVYKYSTYLQPATYAYSYQFDASDGVSSISTGTISGPTVSLSNTHSPSLSAGNVTPLTGYNGSTLFVFSVIYTDADNNGPSFLNVTVNSTIYAMTRKDPLDNNYVDGCIYELSTSLSSVGSYTYRFDAFDGLFSAAAGPYAGVVVDLYYPIAFDGMFYNYTVHTRIPLITQNRTDRFVSAGGGEFFVNSTWNNRTIDGATRAIVHNNGSNYLVDSHEPVRIFTNVQVGSVVPIVVLNYGDQQFTVTGTEIRHAMNRPFECWVLESPEGSIAYYEKFSGILVNGTFQYFVMGLPSNYSIQVTTTDVPLSPNAHDPELINMDMWSDSGDQRGTSYISIVYRDLDDNASVYVHIIFDGVTYSMFKNDSSDVMYNDGCMYNRTFSYLQPGNYSYHFECSDGLFSIVSQTYTLVVNETNLLWPSLSGPQANPPSNPESPAHYLFRITYTDIDNNAPRYVNVTINGTVYSIAKQNPSDVNYMDGSLYQANISLDPGTYTYQFWCADSTHQNSTGTFSLVVNIFTPTLDTLHVSPPGGSVGPANFTISIIYTDLDNNAPTYVNITINGSVFAMAKQDPLDDNYMDGCNYTFTIALEPGTYPFSISCADALFTATPFSDTLVVSAQFPTAWVIVIVAIAGFAIAIGAAASARKKKAKTANLAPKEKKQGKIRAASVKKLPNVQAPASIHPPSQYQGAPAAKASPVTLGKYQCPSCTKEYKFTDPDLAQRFTCPDCKNILLRIIVCSKCGKPMSITQDNFPNYIGKDIQCPECKNVFKV
nr:NosD domain-containing protein [Candidatus Sigynarchaeota archaeon]